MNHTRMVDTTTRPLYNSIARKLTLAFTPVKLAITDDSHLHRGHSGVQGSLSPETHFSVEIVSEKFQGHNRVQRQRLVNAALQEEFEKGLHALGITCKTPEEP